MLLLPATCATTRTDKRRDHVAWMRRARREVDVVPGWGSEPLHHIGSGPVIELPSIAGLNTVQRHDVHSLQIEPNSIDMIFTDPPYDRASLPLYEAVARLAARVLKDGKFCLVMSGGLYNDQILDLMAKHLTYYWTFHITMSGMRTGAVHPGGNPNPIITRIKPVHAFVKGWGMPRTVMYDPVDSSGPDKRFHHWGQDLGSARYFIDCFTSEGDIVLDPYCGGGTTPFICQTINRNFLAFDADPKAVEVTRARLRNPLFMLESDQMRLAFAV